MRPEPERIVFASEHFFVMLSLGPIVDGYSLVITKEHIDCCGAIPDEWLPEFENLVHALSSAQTKEFGASVLFEHGRTGSCLPDARGEPHCHHAHLHCVPTQVNVAAGIRETLSGETFASWHDVLVRYRATNRPYLLADDSGQLTYFEVDDRVESQFLRRIVASGEGKPELWDWVAFQGRDQIERAAPRLARALRQHLR